MTRVDDVLSGHLGAEGVRAALRASPLRRSVRAHVVDIMEPASLGRCRLHRTKFKPGHKLSAWFDAPVVGHGARRDIAVSWWGSDGAHFERTDVETQLETEAEHRGLMTPFVRLIATAPDQRMRLTIAPLDATFPQLVRLSDPVYAAALLDWATPPRVVAVRYRPNQRHVLCYQLTAGNRGPVVFAKLYRDDSGVQCQRVADAVADFLGECEREHGARPMAYVHADRVLLVPLVPGVPLSSSLLTGNGRTAAHLRDAGSMLRLLHAAPSELASLLPMRSVHAELDAITRATEAIQHLLPVTGALVHDILARTSELLSRPPREPPQFTHGDYKADHLLVGATGVTLIDFDRCARSDPALDIAKFLADLRWWTGQASHSARKTSIAQELFLGGYGSTSPERLTRARLLEPLQLLKLAARRVPIHAANWEQRTAALVEEAHGLLSTRAIEVCA
jgi:hypothetical protein